MALKIKTHDDVKVTEKLHNYKAWFNGLKRFIAVKVLPPKG